VARALQCIADRDADGVVRVVHGLLATARHLHQEPGGIAWMFAAQLETQAAALCVRANALDEPAVERLRAEIEAHLETREPLANVCVALRGESERLFDGMLQSMRVADDKRARLVREFEREMRRQFVEAIEPGFAACAALPDAPTEAQMAPLRAWEEQLGQRLRDRKAALKQLDGSKPLGPEAVADVSLMLVSLIVPNLSGAADAQAESISRLRACLR
jgi:hypothetical protein